MKRARTLCGALLVAISISLISAANAAHPGRNGLIAYVAGDSIFTIYPDGSHKKKLTVPEQGTFRLGAMAYPTWSPNGKRIAFIAVRTLLSGGEPEIALFVMNADGSDVKNVAPVASTTDLSAAGGPLSWSPDGSKIAYTHGTQGRQSIAVVNIDPRNGERALSGAYDPAWSPDGRTIVFASGFGLHAWDLQSGIVRPLGTGPARRPEWSPDGSKLIFDTGWDVNSQIREVNADGSGMRILFHGLPGGYGAAWSPDGTKIIITRQPPVGPSIEYLQPDGTTRRLGKTSFLGTMPDWQPCGQGARCPVMTPCVVPRVIGFSVTRARAAIRKAGCTVGTIKRPRNVALAKTVVAKQSPRPRTRVPHDSKVNLVLRRRR